MAYEYLKQETLLWMILAKNVTLHVLQISSQFSQGGKKNVLLWEKGRNGGFLAKALLWWLSRLQSDMSQSEQPHFDDPVTHNYQQNFQFFFSSCSNPRNPDCWALSALYELQSHHTFVYIHQ